ncbi:MAG: sulfotransferase domain-containing protein [Bacteroidetes bacterium]|nr:sulfotransferase domain-containing protein [Bacteroidota bacterium]
MKKEIASFVKYFLPGYEPDFLIVGAQKAGTTSLFYYLDQHPEMFGAPGKELRFFDRDENYKQGISWYKKKFIELKKPLIRGRKNFEATPEYLYRLNAIQRIYNFKPDLKIIILLREPVKRAFSAWNMYRDFQISREKLPKVFYTGYIEDRANQILSELYQNENFPSFEEAAIADVNKYKENSIFEEPSFIRRGIYYPQVKRYFDLFGRDNVKIIGFKDLIGKNKIQVLNDLLAFLEMPSSNWSFLEDERRNARDYPFPLKEEMKAFLSKFYQPHNEQLFELLGFKPNW